LKEKQFWNRILEFAQERLTRSMYDFYATPAELIKVEENTATIFLPRSEMEMVWEKQLKDIIVAAGFEIYDSEIKPHYIFTKPQSTESPQVNDTNSVSTYDYTPALPTIPYSETGLKEKYTFDNFIQGDGNVWAVSAALAVSEDLALTYNPLFIYGGPGLGKTHLLNAIGNEILKNIPDARVKYIPAESFINDFLEHLRLGEMEKFKKTYRSLDLLLIDDIQSLSGKKVATQEEFFNTFNALHDKQKQIVLTSDRSPKHLEGLEERLVTRFSWGLTQNITPPDFETRIAILQSKTEHLDYHFQSDTLEYLAGQFDSNVRELEGAINDITLIARVKKIKDITIDIAAEAIRARKQDARQILVIPIEKIHWYRALPVLVTSSLIFLASLYFLTPLATMKTIEFTGNKVVSQEELRSSSKIDQRDYTVTVYKNRHHYEQNLKASSPWIENVEMTYQFPLTFKIDVQEYGILGYLQKDSKYYPILTSGKYVKNEVAADALPEERMDVTFSDAGLIKEFVQQLKNVPDSVKKSIRKVDLTPSKVTEDLVTITMSDEHQILVPISHIAKKLPYYEGIHPQLEVPSVVDMEAGIFSYAQGTENEVIHEASNDAQDTESSAQHAEQSTEHSAQSQAEKPEISENN